MRDRRTLKTLAFFHHGKNIHQHWHPPWISKVPGSNGFFQAALRVVFMMFAVEHRLAGMQRANGGCEYRSSRASSWKASRSWDQEIMMSILLMATRNPGWVPNHRLDGAKTLTNHGINYQPPLVLLDFFHQTLFVFWRYLRFPTIVRGFGIASLTFNAMDIFFRILASRDLQLKINFSKQRFFEGRSYNSMRNTSGGINFGWIWEDDETKLLDEWKFKDDSQLMVFWVL